MEPREETGNVPLVVKAYLQCVCNKQSHYSINDYTDEYPIYILSNSKLVCFVCHCLTNHLLLFISYCFYQLQLNKRGVALVKLTRFIILLIALLFIIA